jgi:predicted helicase
MVKNPEKTGHHKLFYHDIGDYHSREEKLQIVKELGSVQNVDWQELQPNDEGDWVSQRNPEFMQFMPLGDKENDKSETLFDIYSLGVVTNRDAWAYNFSHENLMSNMGSMIAFFNKQSKAYATLRKASQDEVTVDSFIDTDARKISWTHNIKTELTKGSHFTLEDDCVVSSHYRPFCKQWLYFNRRFNERVYQMPKIFPNAELENLVISATGIGASKDFSAIISDSIPNLHLHDTSQCFPLYYYAKPDESEAKLFQDDGYIRREAISDAALKRFRSHYETKVKKEDIFYYVYGILHSPEYKERFASDLKKMLPRIPLAHDFWVFSKAGRKLAKWHLEYESVEPYALEETISGPRMVAVERFRVSKMSFPRKDGKPDKSVIVYNSNVTLSGIPPEAYGYVVNGKSALEWIMERYQISVDKDSGISNDPNEWSADPRYIVDLVTRIVRVSLETVKIVQSLPALQEDVANVLSVR